MSTDPFVVSCIDWSENQRPNQLAYDFYAVKEIDKAEGKVLATSVGYFGNSKWTMRSGNPIVFWVRSLDAEFHFYKVSYFPPQDAPKEDARNKGSKANFAFLLGHLGQIEPAVVQSCDKNKPKNKISQKKENHLTPSLFD